MKSRRALQRRRRFRASGLPPATLRAVVEHAVALMAEHGLSLPDGTGDFAEVIEHHAADDHLLFARDNGDLTWLTLSRAATCAVHAAYALDLRAQLIESVGTQLAWLCVEEQRRRT